MTDATNQTVLTLGLLGVGLYFSVLVVRGLRGYLMFRRLRSTALATWSVGRPGWVRLLVALGGLSGGVAILSALRARPLLHIYSQAVMALYFALMVPLAMRIRRGLYRDGVWSDTGFVPYADIGRLAFRETPEIVLILVARRRPGTAVRLGVPPSEYGTVRKLIEQKRRDQVLRTDEAILGL